MCPYCTMGGDDLIGYYVSLRGNFVFFLGALFVSVISFICWCFCWVFGCMYIRDKLRRNRPGASQVEVQEREASARVSRQSSVIVA